MSEGNWILVSHLDDIQNGDVAVLGVAVQWSGHHHVLRLKESAHHIQYCCLPY